MQRITQVNFRKGRENVFMLEGTDILSANQNV